MEDALLKQVEEYIQDNYWYSEKQEEIKKAREEALKKALGGDGEYKVHYSISVSEPPKKPTLSERLRNKIDKLFTKREDTFTQRLWKLIKEKGLSDVEVYKRANLDRRLFSKMRKEKSYKPSRGTAIAIAIALELEDEEFDDLLKRAGFALSGGNKEDVIVQFFIDNKQYDVFLINEALEHYGLPILGERKS